MMRDTLFVWMLVTGAFGIGVGTGWWFFDDTPPVSTLKATYDCTREREQSTSLAPSEHHSWYTFMPDKHWWRHEPGAPRVSEIPWDGQHLHVPGPETVDIVFHHDLTAMAHIRAPAGAAMEGETIIIELRSPAPARADYLWDARYSAATGVRLPEHASGQYDVCKFLLIEEHWVALTCTENTQSLVPFERRLECSL